MVEEDSCAVSNLRRASHALAPASPSHSHPQGADSYTHRGPASLGRDLVVGYSLLPVVDAAVCFSALCAAAVVLWLTSLVSVALSGLAARSPAVVSHRLRSAR